VTLSIPGCLWWGGDDKSDKRERFHIRAEAVPYGGPVPLKVKFTVVPREESGEVRYHWRFDDGTTTDEQNPTHVFKKAGNYRVIVDAVDEKNFNDRWNLILGAWPPKVWERGVSGLSKRRILKLQADQRRRTRERKREIRATEEQRSREPKSGTTG
jgi:hypothetical protein